MSLADRALRTIRRHGMVSRGGRVAVALSGGPDSVALVHVMRELESRGELVLAGLAHFNHQLRGADADADEAFCREMARSLDLPIEVGRGDVRALAREERRSVEDAGRVARYAFLDGAARILGAERIAVGHTRDDQAETVLLRLIRGSGTRGLAGILPRAGRIVRPLLDVERAELRDYAAALGLASRADATNEDVSVPRNRVRHELLPYLQRDFSPAIVDVLARAAAVAREDDECLERQAIDLAAGGVLTVGAATSDVEVNVSALERLHPALAARVAQQALRRAGHPGFIGFDHVDRFLEFLSSGRAGALLSLPGQQAVHRGDRVVLGPEPPRGPAAASVNSFEVLLSIPGEVTLDRQGWAISAERLPEGEPGAEYRVGRGGAVAVASAPLKLPLTVRSRKPGDRFRPLGLGGRGKKLQDFLVDRKIPREMRDLLPIVVDRDDRIVWVVGESLAEDFRVTEPSQGVLLLKARRLGGLG